MRDRSVTAFAIALAAAFPLTFLVVVAACIPVAQPSALARPGDTQLAARQSAARSLGYPTRKSADELAAMIAQQTKDFTLTAQHAEGRLEAPAPLVIDGTQGTCYTIVMRLGAGATWGDAAEAGRDTCGSEYRSCAFEEAGPDYGSACRFPQASP